MEILGSLIVIVSTALWVLLKYGKRFPAEKLMWIFFFYVVSALAVSWFLTRIIARIPKPSFWPETRRFGSAVGNRVSSFLARAVPAALGKKPGLLACSIVYVLFCRSPLDTFVMATAVVFSALAVWAFVASVSSTLTLVAAGVAAIALVCALSLSVPIVDQLMALRRCTPPECYARYCSDAPAWAWESLEGAYSYQIGLSAPLERYRSSWPAILGWDLGKQTRMADLIVRSRSSDQAWLRAWFDAHPKGRGGTRMVANLAWLLLNEPAARTECRKRIDAITEKHGKKND